MYARRVNGRTLSFAPAGLWEGSLVLLDRPTGSLWSQLLGRAMRGPLEGVALESIPAVLTRWKIWRSRYPQTTWAVLPDAAHGRRSAAPRAGRGYVVGLTAARQARAWNLADVCAESVVNDELNESSILVVCDPTAETILLYNRDVGGRQLVFEHRAGELVDRGTGSEWDALTGTATTGPLQGRQMNRLPGMVLQRDAWYRFHPESTTWRPSR